MLLTRGLSPDGRTAAVNLSESSWRWSWRRVAGNGESGHEIGENGMSNTWVLCSASDSNPGLLGGVVSPSSSE